MKRKPFLTRAGCCAHFNAFFRLLLLVLVWPVLLTGGLAPPLQARIWDWLGDGPDNLWSNANNWTDATTGAHGLPRNGDDLRFYDGSLLTGPASMNNDLTNLVVNSMGFDVDDLFQVDWVLNGNALIISNTVASSFGNFSIGNAENGNSYVHINVWLELAAPATIETGGVPVDGAGSVVPMELKGPIHLNGHNLTLVARTADYPGSVEGPSVGHLGVSSEIFGQGNVTVIADPGSLVVFVGPTHNLFSGVLTASAALGGVIRFNAPGGDVAPDALVVNNVGTVELLLPDQIGDSAAVTISAGATLRMNGHNDTIGSLNLINVSADAQPSALDTGGGLVTVNGDISATCNNDNHTPIIRGHLALAPGTHQVRTSGSAYAGLEMQAQVSGSGNFQKIGSSALLLEANNDFNSSISILSGILDVRHNHALGDVAGDTSLFGGTLLLRNVNIGTERLSAEGQGIAGDMPGSLLTVVGSSSWAGQVLLDTNLVVLGGDVIFTGDISGLGGIGFFNLGNSILGGSLGNTYSGRTLVRCPLLQFNKPSGINAYAGPLEVGGGAGGPYEARWLNSYQNVGATLAVFADGIVNLNNHNEDFGAVTFRGGEVDTGSGQFTFYQPLTVQASAAPVVINGNLGLPPGVVTFNVDDGAAEPDLLVNAVVFGTGSPVVKQGAGTLRFTQANTYTGATIIDEGVLQADNPASLGDPLLGAHSIVHSNATLRLHFSGTMTESLFLAGAGAGGTGGAVAVDAGNSLSLIAVTLDHPSTLNVGAGGGLTINNPILGNGPLTKTGPGFLQLAGAGNNAYAGDTIVAEGALNLVKSANGIAVPHNLVVGPASSQSPAVARFYQTGGLGGTVITVNANSLLDLNGFNQALTTLNLRDGGSVQTRAGLLDFPSGGDINVGSLSKLGSHVGSFISGVIGLPANARLNFNVSPYASFFPFATGAELDVLAVIPRPNENVSFAPAGINKTGAGQMRLGATNTYVGSSFINGGTLWVDGLQPQSPIQVNSGTLGGAGTVGAINMNSAAAVVAPGHGPGLLTCGSLNEGITASGVLRIDLNGTMAGTGYDQLVVRGSVNLAGVTLQTSLGFTPPVGAQFDFISNDGLDAVGGNFNGLLDGAKLYIGGVLYQVNYRFGGRGGNDVALQGLDTPPLPTLIIQRLAPASVRLLWPTNDPPFTLQASTNLSTATWTAALPLPVVNGTNNIVTAPSQGRPQFYRLISGGP